MIAIRKNLTYEGGATRRHPRKFGGLVRRSRRRGRRENGPGGIAGRVRLGGRRR